MKYQHWHLQQDAQHIAWLTFDKQNSAVNTFDSAVMEELSTIIQQLKASLQQDNPPIGLVIQSAKEAGFIAGADIQQFQQLQDVNEAVDKVRAGQQLFTELAALQHASPSGKPFPTVAMIQGFCLGGGLEISLACTYRIALDDPGTRLGLPEVKLGIIPGWGGTVRLPQLIGPLNAMDLILSGRTVTAKAAHAMGLVDAAVPLRQLKRAAIYYIVHTPRPHEPTTLQKIANTVPFRTLISALLRHQVAKKAKPHHYPAPYEAIDNWQQHGAIGHSAFLQEGQSTAKLLMTHTSQNLVRVFFLQERLKSLTKHPDASIIRHVHVVGAGTMGGDIAAWCALRGMVVTLQDRKASDIAPALQRARGLFKKKLKKPRLIQGAMDRLIPDVKGEGISKADLIIEAIFEDLAVKQELFKQLEAKAKPQALLATNTSSILLDKINSVLKAPERLIGIHFFNPVAMMPLVEVVKGEKTALWVEKAALRFVGDINRLPLPVKSAPGFLVNRILMPYLLESVLLAAEGVPLASIDRAAEQFGMPMGPIELADTVGLDVCLAVANNLTQSMGGTVPEVLMEKVAAGHLGKKTGQGFYTFKKGKAVKPKATHSAKEKEVIQRLITRVLEEAERCLEEGIVADKELLDAGMIFGTGFAPFRGGPMYYKTNLNQ
ncbi:MAG: 3-hydroxyacyl-CoA dehydrogenase NAD-binding domain-containing protein [Gammaproteobacteria bacterium]